MTLTIDVAEMDNYPYSLLGWEGVWPECHAPCNTELKTTLDS
jgi:hypothetical protein